MSFQSIMQMTLSGILPSLITAGCIYLFYWKKRKQHSFVVGWLALYICMLLYVTIYRYGISINKLFMERPAINITPLVSTYQLYEYGGWLIFLYNILGNIIWFLPFGFLLPCLHKKYDFITVFFSSLTLSFCIEIGQFLLNCGISDIDDLIFNVIGGCIGYGCYLLMKKYLKR